MTLDEMMSIADSYADGPHEQGYYGARRNALRAAIEQYARGDAEPVAYIVDEHCSGEPQLCFPDECVDWQKGQDRKLKFVPLYTRPSHPLTDEQIGEVAMGIYGMRDWTSMDVQFARAIERAHGITATKDKHGTQA